MLATTKSILGREQTMAIDELATNLKEWSNANSAQIVDATPGKRYELQWRLPGQNIFRFITVYPQQNDSTIAEYGAYAIPLGRDKVKVPEEMKQKGPAQRYSSVADLKTALPELKASAEELSGDPWEEYAMRAIPTAAALKLF
jgi:hypothetical protein